jgi:hypothetical protein
MIIIRRAHLLGMAALTVASTALVMNDLPTPSLVIHMQALQRYMYLVTGKKSAPIPPLALSNDRGVLYPTESLTDLASPVDCTAPPISLFHAQDSEPFCYFHSTVRRSREQAVEGHAGAVSTFLAELDLLPTECGNSGAKLVLGLNNHHVGSYYWARSAGSGASMEAPGVLFDMSGKSGNLRWDKEGGFTECNSNDGKRSEWVNFLRAGDTVQLLPFDVDDAILSITAASEGSYDRIFGVSSKNRPLGSEPEVVCKWRLQQ